MLLYIFLSLYFLAYTHGQKIPFNSLEDNLLKELMTQKDDYDMPQNIIVEEDTPNVQINCKTTSGVSKIVWRIETISERKFIAVIAENGRVSGGWKNSHAINASLPGQNTLVIKKATMKNAGKYSCQLYHNNFKPQSYLAEVIIVVNDPTTGRTLAPSGYFNWIFRYSGNLKPFFRCSNGEVVNGVQGEEATDEDSTIELTFNGCFLDQLPEECTLMAADYFNNRFAVFKIYNISEEYIQSKYTGSRQFNASEKIHIFAQSHDRVISLDEGSSYEFKCDYSPTPDVYSWVFTNPDRECLAFDVGTRSVETRLPFKYHIVSPSPTSSHLIIFHFGASAAGNYRCIGTYWTDDMRNEHTSAELTVVLKHDELVTMIFVEESIDQFAVKFEITYRGNLKPFLQCSSVRVEAEKSILDFQNILAIFNSEVSLSGVPVACRCSFRNEKTRQEIFFKDFYVRVKRNSPDLQFDFRNTPALKSNEEYDLLDVPYAEDKIHEVPKSVVATKTKKMAVFPCEMDRDAVSLTWEFTSLLRDFKGAIIFQTKVGVSPYVDHLYRVDTSQNGIYTLAVKRIIPKTVGTYKCNLFYTNKPTVTHTVQLVIANAGPMQLKVLNNGLKSRGETFSKVLFEKEINFTQLPFQCDVWFKDEEGKSILFQLGETRLKHLRRGISSGKDQLRPCYNRLQIISTAAIFLFILQ